MHRFIKIMSTKIKSNTRTKALQNKRKINIIKQVGWISLYYTRQTK